MLRKLVSFTFAAICLVILLLQVRGSSWSTMRKMDRRGKAGPVEVGRTLTVGTAASMATVPPQCMMSEGELLLLSGTMAQSTGQGVMVGKVIPVSHGNGRGLLMAWGMVGSHVPDPTFALLLLPNHDVKVRRGCHARLGDSVCLSQETDICACFNGQEVCFCV